ncbi:phosphoribosylanthranilate isomerase [cf. Phormidesmis sp. LEGE 11477]|uniref:phosphoribosylanthranilate isomerase n=1 Tax=cf. Phormidesmis sp. LEGE 11477 TaxID=1828680 RepID=UPI001880C97B|nr:phosphoribosylanthranilate isomerase [cf. Phormidesmis sp. LEGE 11477]MBE9061567.1 phosphoribosylanthranilate isomerase [cf. Phormidesmis sp. LEGE 11477]
MLQVKICGITQVEQAQAIASLGATALGYICVARSPRYISAENIAPIVATVSRSAPQIEHFGVFADAPLPQILNVTKTAGLGVIQLHSNESPATCQRLRDVLNQADLSAVKIVKAIRVRTSKDLETALSYEACVDSLLLDAYHPEQLGGTGETLDWRSLQSFSPNRPWFLAGGLNPGNVLTALTQLAPNGIDLSSGVERSPGNKDLSKVAQLFDQLRTYNNT